MQAAPRESASYLQHHYADISCTEKLRLATRVSLLAKDYESVTIALTKARGHMDESSYVRRCRDIKRGLTEARSAYLSHLSVHGC